jgi:hypothetical protein
VTTTEFEEYYQEFEHDRLGHSAMHGHLFQSDFFDKLVSLWFNDNLMNCRQSKISLPQIILECLAYSGPMTLKQLIKRSNTKEKDVINILDNYSTKNDLSNPDNQIKGFQSNDASSVEMYQHFMRHTLIIIRTTNLEVRYELSLFGIMLAMCIITYHYIGIDNHRFENINNTTILLPSLFYKNTTLEEFYDKIAYNYKDKLPLLFKKWAFLKAELGSSLLFSGFNFLIYKNANLGNIRNSIWLGGNKEFYDDLRSIANNARIKLYSIYEGGKKALERFQEWRDTTNARE